MGPGLFSDIGRKTRDLLYKDYSTDQTFTFTSYTNQNAALVFSGTKKGKLVFGEILSQIKNNNTSIDIRVNSDSNLVTTITQNELLKPGLRGIFSLVVPDQRSGKVELQYLHEYAGLTATAGLTTNPVVGVSAVFGTSAISFGADVAFDTATSSVTKYNIGMSHRTAEFAASLTLTNQGDSMNGAYYHLVNPVTAVGAEVVHRLSNNTTNMAFGAAHKVDSRNLLKARVSSYGVASALIHHAFLPSSLICVSIETDLLAVDSIWRLGLALALKP